MNNRLVCFDLILFNCSDLQYNLKFEERNIQYMWKCDYRLTVRKEMMICLLERNMGPKGINQGLFCINNLVSIETSSQYIFSFPNVL